MPRIEGTKVYESVRKEGSPPIAPTVAKSFLDLLKDVRKPFSEIDRSYYDFQSTPELEERITGVLDAACVQVPGINRNSLDKIVKKDPYSYPEWPIGMRHQGADADWSSVLDFPQLAANWNNDMYVKQRAIAKRDYGVGVKELDFLRAVFEQIPPVVRIYQVLK